MNEYMKMAIDEALIGIDEGHGGPFGTIIVKNGKVVGRGHNRVVIDKDPTAHGEMVAIRDACKNLSTFDLSGAELYTTAEPCPMCLGGILWANIDKVYYGCNIIDTEEIGFRDSKFYEYLEKKSDILEVNELDRKECKKLFDKYSKMTKTMY